MNSKSKGDLSEAAVLKELLRLGLPVSVPWGDNQRYDLVVDVYGKLLRCQVKTASLRGGTLRFSCRSTYRVEGEIIQKDYHGDIELFLVYSPDLDNVYVVPVEDTGVANVWLRIKPGKAIGKHPARNADDYLAEKWRNGIATPC